MDVMLDLETLGTDPGSVIVSISAVAFPRSPWAEFDVEAAAWFHAKLDLFPQIVAGMTIDNSTVVDFWQREPEAADMVTRELNVHNPAEAWNGLHAFVAEHTNLDGGGGLVWSQGQSFDFPIVHAMTRSLLLLRRRPHLAGSTLWPFWVERDTRSVYTAAKMVDPQFDPKRYRIGMAHHGLDDCRSQVVALHNALACFVPAKRPDGL